MAIQSEQACSGIDKKTAQAIAAAAKKRSTVQPLHRVVLTGMGAVTPAGVGADVLIESLMQGKNNLSLFPEETAEQFGTYVVGAVPDFDATEHGLSKKQARRWSSYVQYAVISADEALAQSGIDLEKEDLDRFAVVFGTGIGGMKIFSDEAVKLHEKGPKRVSPLFIPSMMPNAAAGELAIRYGLRGECIDVSTACATGTQSIGEAYRMIRFGYADCALAGGSEESVCGVAIAGFGNLGATSKSHDVDAASMPFDIRRNGFVPGEGGAAVVLESLEHAQARGAHIIAEVTGYGSTGDGYHITSPEPGGAGILRAMQQALAEGGFEPADLGHLNAHGTATHINDKTESEALAALMGTDAPEVPVVSVKGSVGHMLGGAGAVEALVTAYCVSEGVVPPTVGFAEPDPECKVRVLTEALTDYPQKVALSTSLGFGGHNGCLAFSPYVEDIQE